MGIRATFERRSRGDGPWGSEPYSPIRRTGSSACVRATSALAFICVATSAGTFAQDVPTPKQQATSSTTSALMIKSVEESAVIRPAAIDLEPQRRRDFADVLVSIQVSTLDDAGELTLSIGPLTSTRVRITAAPLELAQADVASSGTPTGKVSRRYRLTFDDIPDRLDATTVPIRVRAGKFSRSVDLSVSNVGSAPVGGELTLKASSSIRWSADSPIAIIVKAKGANAPHLSLAAGPFQDTMTRAELHPAFCLAETATSPCNQTISLGLNEERSLVLRAASSETSSGRYTGIVSLLAANGLEASQALTLEVTNSRWWWFGVVALIAGVVLSLFLTVLVPHWRARDANLRSVALIAARLKKLESQLPLDVSLKAIRTEIADIYPVLDLEWLRARHMIPGVLPPAGTNEASTSDLKAHLQQQAERVARLELIGAALNRAQQPQQFQDLDALTPNGLVGDQLIARIQGVLAPGMVRSKDGAAPFKIASLSALVVQEDLRTAAYWIVSAILTIMFGFVLLIDSNPAFGGWRDLAAAFLWGLGLSTAGGKLADITGAQLRTALLPSNAVIG